MLDHLDKHAKNKMYPDSYYTQNLILDILSIQIGKKKQYTS